MKKNTHLILLLLVIWFVISFVTNVLGPIIPLIKLDFKLNLTLAAFLPFSFFLAYGIMSIPAGIMIEKLGGKKSLLIAFTFNFFGAFYFVLFPTYQTVLISLFIIGLGMATLQVIILPLMREIGGEKNYAFNSVLSQIVFGLASFLSPFVATLLIRKLALDRIYDSQVISIIRNLIPDNLPWASLYLTFTVVFAIMLIVILILKFPKVELKENERAGTFQEYKVLLKNKYVILYFLGIVAYVGSEQGLANWMSQFLNTYHGINPVEQGAATVAWFWGLMSIGCLIGLLIVKLIDSKIMLRLFAILALLTLSLALFGPASVSIIAFPFCGFSISIMFSIIFSLALNSVEKYHGAFSGILCTGIFGGALVPLIIGWLGDLIGLRFSMSFLFITLAYIFSLSFWAKPLIKNEVIKIHKNGIANLFGAKN